MTSNKILRNFGTFCSNESNWAFSGYFCKECKKRSNTDVSCSYKNRSYFASSAAALGLTLGLGESKASEARRNKSVSCSQRCCLEKQIFLLQPFWRTILNLPKFLVIWSSLLQSFWRTILIQFLVIWCKRSVR